LNNQSPTPPVFVRFGLQLGGRAAGSANLKSLISDSSAGNTSMSGRGFWRFPQKMLRTAYRSRVSAAVWLWG
jgi:hypothetical protein